MKRILAICMMSVAIAPLALAQQSATMPATPPAATPDYGSNYDAHPAAPVMIAPSTGPRCPWMNLGTAAGFLGDTVTVKLSQDKGGAINDCRFSRASGAGELQIHVVADAPRSAFTAAAQQSCPAQSTTLHAIGNEAIECHAPNAPNESVVAGRVRDQVFTIRLMLPDATLANTNAREAAEQVAGNLF
jgi:hypothetical protein